MPWARASELDRVMACPAAAHLPRVLRPMGDAAQWGNTLHAWKETGSWGNTSAKIVDRRLAALHASGHTRESLYPDTGAHEVSYALHTQSRVVETFLSPDRDEREAWKTRFDSEWLTGTCDYTGEILGEPWVDDLKSGRFVPDDPWDLWQLRFYAVCACIVAHSEVVHVSVTHWARYPADGHPRRLWAGGSDPAPVPASVLLNETLPALEALRQRVVASWDRTDARAGDHCQWCDAAPNCPVLRPQTDNPFA